VELEVFVAAPFDVAVAADPVKVLSPNPSVSVAPEDRVVTTFGNVQVVAILPDALVPVPSSPKLSRHVPSIFAISAKLSLRHALHKSSSSIVVMLQ
jgi:hypothetical protein